MKLAVLFVSACALQRGAAEQNSVRANPIRKVVSMLQSMQKKVAEEGEREEALFKKYRCYCKTSGGDLEESIANGNAKAPQVSTQITEGEEKNAQLKTDVKQAQSDRAAAKDAIAEATAIREKAAAAFAAEKAESESNINALTGAISALEKGVGSSFLQSRAASSLKALFASMQESDKFPVNEGDRSEVLAFLSGASANGYAPQSGEIIGILKEMLETMAGGLKGATEEEEADIKSFNEVVKAKKGEIAAQTQAIETKTVRSGELAVEIVEMQHDLSLTQKALKEDQKFLVDLQTNCKTKESEWEEISKTRSEEQLALAETIKILNDDDALELFKKTLPSASASLLQVRVSSSSTRQQALEIIRAARSAHNGVQLDLLSIALNGKSMGFEKVVKMIDEMVALLRKEQVDDDEKKEYCGAQFDATDDKKKALERAGKDLDASIEEAKSRISALTEEISTLSAGVEALDKNVAEATEQRKAEHVAFTELISSDSAAKELLGIAKNRLRQFYQPKLYMPPPEQQLAADDRIVVGLGGVVTTPAPGGIAGTGVTALVQEEPVFVQVAAHTVFGDDVAPGPAPESFKAYSKKSEESTGVIAMMDLLIKDLDKEMTEAKVTEKDGQADYENLMADSKVKRASDAKAIEDKSATKADLAAHVQERSEEKTANTKELAATVEVIAALHSECDWLIQYFDTRKEARDGEIASLANAKAVLSGADYK